MRAVGTAGAAAAIQACTCVIAYWIVRQPCGTGAMLGFQPSGVGTGMPAVGESMPAEPFT